MLEVAQRRLVLLAAGAALAVLAPAAAPDSPLLPKPEGAPEYVLGAVVLAAAFAAGLLAPRPALYALFAAAVLEGAVRKWVVNDITVFLVKDFLVLGIYAAVLPRLRAHEWRRSPWIVVPLVLLLALALVFSLRSDSLRQALVGLRAYAIYVPLLWVAPKLLSTPRRVEAYLLLVLAIGVGESLLATVQALTQSDRLNETLLGAAPALATTNGDLWVRPTGTMLQTGTLAAFFLFPTLVALALVMRHRRGPMLALGLASLALLAWGILYTGSRSLFAVVAVAAAALLVYLLWHRRLLALAAVPAALAAGYLLIAQPARDGGTRPLAGGDLAEVLGASGGAPGKRLRDQLELLLEQGLLGHGTGALTLGSQYVEPVRDQAAESVYVKLAHELGLPALVLYVLFLVALWASAAWASFVAYEWRRPAAVVALGAATLVPLLSAVTFALDYPAVAIAYYVFTGCALAWAARQTVPAPIPTPRAGRLAGSPEAPIPERG